MSQLVLGGGLDRFNVEGRFDKDLTLRHGCGKITTAARINTNSKCYHQHLSALFKTNLKTLDILTSMYDCDRPGSWSS